MNTFTESEILAEYNFILGCAKHHLGRDLYTAQDIAQEVVMKALANPLNLTGGDVKNWLSVLTLNAIRDLADTKKTAKRGGGVDTYDIDQIVRDSLEEENGLMDNSAESIALFHEMNPELIEALDSLDKNIRQVVWLAVVEGLEYKEVAEALQVPIGTVMSRLSRGKEQLRKFLS